MVVRGVDTLASLYETDETAWLDEMARLVAERRIDRLDFDHLQEYFEDMARRDRREVKSRLTTLLAHLLKWQCQPDKRSGSWRATILTQSQELSDLARGGVLRAHAEAVLTDAFANARDRAAAETGLPLEAFPSDCGFTIDQLLAGDPTVE